MKIKDKQLRKIIKEALSEFKDTYGGNPDTTYIRPNGHTSIYSDELPGDRKFNIHFNGHNFDPMKRKIQNSDTIFGSGKAQLCFKLNMYMNDLFGVDVWGTQTGKINWTEDELKQIVKIGDEVRRLAGMSKTEAAKRRYGVTDDKLAAMIRENISKVLKEWDGDDLIRWREENGYGDDVDDEELEDDFTNYNANCVDRACDALKEGVNDVVKKANMIMSELKALNFEQRGHEIYDYSGDEDSPEIGVGNMNVPAAADCQMIAEKLGCNFHVNNSWNIGIFELA